MKHLKSAAIAITAALLGVLLVATGARAATPGCQNIPNKACGSWQTPAGGGLDLDVYRQHTTADTPLIVFTATSSDPAEDFEVIPVPAGSVSIYSYAGVQPAPSPSASPSPTSTGTQTALVNIEYTPKGVASGLCISDIDPAAGQAAELRPCNTQAGKYNPFQSFVQVAAGTGDGAFTSFEDAPVTAGQAATGLYLSDSRPQSGTGKPGHRVAVVSAPQTEGGLSEAQLWEAQG